MILETPSSSNHHMNTITSSPTVDGLKKKNHEIRGKTTAQPHESRSCLVGLPAVVPAAIVAATGDWRLLTLDINLNRIPSRAMAKRMRGRGNMQPNRLREKRLGWLHVCTLGIKTTLHRHNCERALCDSKHSSRNGKYMC